MSHQSFGDKLFRAIFGYSRVRGSTHISSVSFGPSTLHPQTGVIFTALLTALGLSRFAADYFLLRDHYQFMIAIFAFDVVLALTMVLGVAVKNPYLLLPAEIIYTALRFILIIGQCFFAACVIFFSYLVIFWKEASRDHIDFLQRAIPTCVLTLTVMFPLVEQTGFYIRSLHMCRRNYGIRIRPADVIERKSPIEEEEEMA